MGWFMAQHWAAWVILLPIGVVTSFAGSIAFVIIFYRARKGDAHA